MSIALAPSNGINPADMFTVVSFYQTVIPYRILAHQENHARSYSSFDDGSHVSRNTPANSGACATGFWCRLGGWNKKFLGWMSGNWGYLVAYLYPREE